MNYRIQLETRARREFLDLPDKARQTIADAIDDLSGNPRPPGSKKIVEPVAPHLPIFLTLLKNL
jgi:mRNA-degrading endonuclease RelE of RelBE toxin-antitoxin system